MITLNQKVIAHSPSQPLLLCTCALHVPLPPSFPGVHVYAPPPILFTMALCLCLTEIEENEASRRAMVMKKKMKRSRGLSFTDADEVIDKFSKVAVVKQRVSSQEQVHLQSCL